jgi:hypothetical protein
MKVKHWRELTTLLVLALIVQGCAVVGPASVNNGRSAYKTPLALEIIEAAGSGVELPDAHLADGVARPSLTGAIASARPAFIAVHSSRERPAHASVAVMHNGWWFYVDARDHRSKQAFKILRTLIGLRLDDGASGQAVPVLTVPVVRSHAAHRDFLVRQWSRDNRWIDEQQSPPGVSARPFA